MVKIKYDSSCDMMQIIVTDINCEDEIFCGNVWDFNLTAKEIPFF